MDKSILQLHEGISNLNDVNQIAARVWVNTAYAVLDNWIKVTKRDIKRYQSLEHSDIINAKIGRLNNELDQYNDVLDLLASKGWGRVP